jgi:hypothetical protein
MFFCYRNICGLLSKHMAGGMALLCFPFLRTAYISFFFFFKIFSPYCHYGIYSSLIENLYHVAAFCFQHTINKIVLEIEATNMI